MIETAFGKLERGGDIVHRGGIVSLLLKEASGGAQDFLTRFRARFLTRFGDGVAKH
jgi:hypothetical protein